MPKRIDLSGQQFGLLTVTGFSHIDIHGKSVWDVACKCGNQVKVTSNMLRTGTQKSCGCRKGPYKHGYSVGKFRPYTIWCGMRDRCNNRNAKQYKDYGGRGISVCDRWMSFELFWEDMKNGYSDELTLDRINNDAGYSKDNCKWSTRKDQNNNKRSTHI